MKILITLSLLTVTLLGCAAVDHNHDLDKKAQYNSTVDYYYGKSGNQYCRGVKRGWLFRCQDQPYEENPEESGYDSNLPGNSYYATGIYN